MTGGLFRVSGGGGEPEVLTTPDAEQDGWPFIIPGRDAVVFVSSAGPPRTTGQLAVLDLTTGDVTRLGLAGVSPRYVSTGHLVYAAEDGSVRAVAFDAASLTGSPVPLVEGVSVKLSGAANFSISDAGSLVYVPGESFAEEVSRELVRVDREGNASPVTEALGGLGKSPILTRWPEAGRQKDGASRRLRPRRVDAGPLPRDLDPTHLRGRSPPPVVARR